MIDHDGLPPIRDNRSDWVPPPLSWRYHDNPRSAPLMELALFWPLVALSLADAWLGAVTGVRRASPPRRR